MDGESFIKETKQDAINPSHYNGTQTIDRMIAVFGVDAVINFCEINAFKYRMRAGKKENNPIEQDIKKALWYEGKAEELKIMIQATNANLAVFDDDLSPSQQRKLEAFLECDVMDRCGVILPFFLIMPKPMKQNYKSNLPI